jgi:hypothetical protein
MSSDIQIKLDISKPEGGSSPDEVVFFKFT